MGQRPGCNSRHLLRQKEHTMNPSSNVDVQVTPDPEWVRNARYVELLARLGESNLPPGGFSTVRQLISATHLRPGMRVLHAGCNAGFLGREVARRTGATVCGIDISSEMAEAATRRARSEKLEGLLSYQAMDMRSMSFENATFDVVLSGGSLAFVEGQAEAVGEWVRVCKPGGLIANAEFYYRDAPPADLLSRISEAIEVNVPEYSREHWFNLFRPHDLVPYYSSDDRAVAKSTDEVNAYCRRMVDFAAHDWPASAQQVLHERLCVLFQLFNENMGHLYCLTMVHRTATTNQEPLLYV